jgi:hypothetical protein
MSLGLTPCIASERLSAVAMADNVLFTMEELEHLERCGVCLKQWAECIAQSGRQIENRNVFD